jgi:sporadic carbohydrate cluster protein (TIGR04323 family)
MNIQSLNKKKFRGYISSRKIGGSFYPQNLQNLLIRSFAKDKNINLQLSGTEWNINNSYLMLRSIIDEKNDGIIFFSLFQLLDDEKEFIYFSKKIVSKKKSLIFCLENIIITNIYELTLVLKKLKLIKLTKTNQFQLNLQSLKKLNSLSKEKI